MWRGVLWTKVFVLVLMVGSDTRLTYYNRLSRRRLGWWAERGKMSPLLFFRDFALFHFLFHVFSHSVSKDSFAACVEQNEFLSIPFLSTVVVTHTSIKDKKMVAIFGLRFSIFLSTRKNSKLRIPQTWSTILISGSWSIPRSKQLVRPITHRVNLPHHICWLSWPLSSFYSARVRDRMLTGAHPSHCQFWFISINLIPNFQVGLFDSVFQDWFFKSI